MEPLTRPVARGCYKWSAGLKLLTAAVSKGELSYVCQSDMLRDPTAFYGVFYVLHYRRQLHATGCTLYVVSRLATCTCCGRRALCCSVGKSRLLIKCFFSSFVGFFCLSVQLQYFSCSYDKHVISSIYGTHSPCSCLLHISFYCLELNRTTCVRYLLCLYSTVPP